MSIPATIAEGFKRRGVQDNIRFYNIAEGSLEELKYFFIPSSDLGYISPADDVMAPSETVGRLLNGVIVSTERRSMK